MDIKKLGRIYEGWKNLVFKDKKVEEIALPRLEICANCPIMKDGFCSKDRGGCGCLCEAKARCIECKCPKNKW